MEGEMLIKIIVSFRKLFTQVSPPLHGFVPASPLPPKKSPCSLRPSQRFSIGVLGILPVIQAVSDGGYWLLSSGRSLVSLPEVRSKMTDTPTSKMAPRTGILQLRASEGSAEPLLPCLSQCAVCGNGKGAALTTAEQKTEPPVL